MSIPVPINVKYAAYGIISTESIAGVPTYKSIEDFEPAMKVKYDPQTSSTTLNGDGSPRRNAVKSGTDDVEVGLNEISLKQYSDLFGHAYAVTGENATPEKLRITEIDKIPYTGFGFCFENDDGSLTAFWYYKGRFEEPGQDVSQIDDNKITYSTPTMKGTFIYAGNKVKRDVITVEEDTGSIDYETLFGLTTVGAQG